MKTQNTEKYYRSEWERLSRKYTKNDPEKDLAILMNGMDKVLTKEAADIVRKIKAQEVYNFLHETLKGTMKTIKAIQSGKASLGYTSQRQEIEERHNLIEGFEFDCLRLADFRKKYNI